MFLKLSLEVNVKVFYSSEQNVFQNESFSPSASKPALALDSWKKLRISFSIENVKPVPREKLYQIHNQKYVDGVLDLKIKNGFGNKNPLVAKALPYICGSMVDSTLHAFKTGEISFSPTSGAHHAHYNHGAGYCTFNFLVLAALEAHKIGAKRVGIIDLDCHPSDGIQDIIEKLNLNFIQLYSFGLCYNAKTNSKRWISQNLKEKCNKFNNCDLIIYNAGCDSHVEDPLGGYLTTEQMKQRDEIVFEHFCSLGIPIAVSLAGGYQKDEDGKIEPVLRLHDNTFISAYQSEIKRNLDTRSNTSHPTSQNYCVTSQNTKEEN